jgi:hypothetical protein
MIRRFLPLIMVAIACSPVVDTTALRADFERQHPGCHVKALAVGAGDSQNLYVRVRYRCASEAGQFEETWVYQRVRDRWIPFAKVPAGTTDQPTHYPPGP